MSVRRQEKIGVWQTIFLSSVLNIAAQGSTGNLLWAIMKYIPSMLSSCSVEDENAFSVSEIWKSAVNFQQGSSVEFRKYSILHSCIRRRCSS